MNIYDPAFVADLFNEMSKSYGVTNYISSLGFCQRWRRQCIDLACIKSGMVVYDLMSGMGECWGFINRDLQDRGKLVALDFSHAMCEKASERKQHFLNLEVEVLLEDLLQNSIPTGSADRVVSCFGLKTFSDEQKVKVAQEIARVLKPGGRFALLEISVPKAKLLRIPFMLYLHYGIPIIGRVMLGNPENYRFLGRYTERFKDCSLMCEILRKHELEASEQSLFFGCATAVYGSRA